MAPKPSSWVGLTHSRAVVSATWASDVPFTAVIR